MMRNSFHEEKNRSRNNIKNDIRKIQKALMDLKGLTTEGQVLREDLLGLLFYENPNQLDSMTYWRLHWDNCIKKVKK